MAHNEEAPVTAKQARATFGWSCSYMSAVRRAMGIRSRYFFLSDVRRFLRANPTFTSAQIYHASRCACAACQDKRARKLSRHSTTPQSMNQPFPEPRTRETAQTGAYQSEPPQNHSELFAQKLRALRGKRTMEELSTLAAVSRETIRKAESGVLPKVATTKRIAVAIGANPRDQQELLTLWFKAQAAEAGVCMRIEVGAPGEEEASLPTHTVAQVVVDQLLAMDSMRREHVVASIRSKEWVAGLFNFISQTTELANARFWPEAANARISAAPPMAPPIGSEDLWGNL